MIDKELKWTTYYNECEKQFITTSNKERSIYKLYIIQNGKPVFTRHTASNPLELEKYIEFLPE